MIFELRDIYLANWRFFRIILYIPSRLFTNLFVRKFWVFKTWWAENLFHVIENILRTYFFSKILIKERHQPNQWLARSFSDYFGLKKSIEYFETSWWFWIPLDAQEITSALRQLIPGMSEVRETSYSQCWEDIALIKLCFLVNFPVLSAKNPQVNN